MLPALPREAKRKVLSWASRLSWHQIFFSQNKIRRVFSPPASVFPMTIRNAVWLRALMAAISLTTLTPRFLRAEVIGVVPGRLLVKMKADAPMRPSTMRSPISKARKRTRSTEQRKNCYSPAASFLACARSAASQSECRICGGGSHSRPRSCAERSLLRERMAPGENPGGHRMEYQRGQLRRCDRHHRFWSGQRSP
jgi:hypothetical protein